MNNPHQLTRRAFLWRSAVAHQPRMADQASHSTCPMPITYHSRTGKTYYLHTGPKRGGGVQHFFSKHLGQDSFYELC